MIVNHLIPLFFVIYLTNNKYGISCTSNSNNIGNKVKNKELPEAIEFAVHRNVKKKDSKIKSLNKNIRNDLENDIDELLNAFAEWQLENSIKNIDPLARKTQKNEPNELFIGSEFQDFEISSDNNRQFENSLESKIKLENLAHKSYAFDDTNNPLFKQSSQLKSENPNIDIVKINSKPEMMDGILIGCLIAGLVVIIATGFCLYAMHKSSKLNNSTDYPQSYGNSRIQSKNVMRNGDKGLAHSAQMYHYQHQKQQMIAMEKATHDMKQEHSDNSEGETDEGDYTVYECPGLAPTGEMEVKNPLFNYGLTSVPNASLNDQQQISISNPEDPKIVKDDVSKESTST